jgi:hypothetical protein
MASDKKKRKLAKQKSPRPKPAVHPDGDRRRRGGPTADQGTRDKRARQQFWGVPMPDEPGAG